MTIIAQRGKSNIIFLVEHNQEYYLVNIDNRTYAKASPANSPDMFLRLGYFYPVKKVKAEIAEQVWAVLAGGQDANRSQ